MTEFSPEGADVAREGLVEAPKKRGRPKGSKNKVVGSSPDPDALVEVYSKPTQRPNYKDLGESIVDHVLTVYPHWKPSDFNMVRTALTYASRLGGYWGKKTRS